MSRKTVSAIMMSLLVLGTLTFAFKIQLVKASGTVYIRADGSVDPPDAPISTVDYVTYTLTASVTSDANGIVVERDNIIVDGAGYTVQGTVTGNGDGIFLNERINVTIKNMEIKAFELGINLYHSSNNTISRNNITNITHTGIYVQNSNNNTISENSVADSWFGIGLFDSSNNVLRYNIMANNTYNFDFFVSGLFVTDFMNDVDASNMVEGNPIYYWVNRQDMTVPLDAGHVVLANCTGITAQNLNLTKNGEGIFLAFTTNSTITKNNIVNNYYGINIYYSTNNTIYENTISGNREDNYYGITVQYSSNNTLSRNNITAQKWHGTELDSSDNNTIIGNTITECWDQGLSLSVSSNNTISENTITDNNFGIELSESSNNTISGNYISNNAVWDLGYGIKLATFSSNNTIIMNNITHNDYGIRLDQSSHNKIYHNNLIENSQQTDITTSGYRNYWDDSYPSGGNYWSDYTGADANNDGIGDTPCIIDANNTDYYPLMVPYVVPEFPSFLILPLFFIATLLAVIIYRRKHPQRE